MLQYSLWTLLRPAGVLPKPNVLSGPAYHQEEGAAAPHLFAPRQVDLQQWGCCEPGNPGQLHPGVVRQAQRVDVQPRKGCYGAVSVAPNLHQSVKDAACKAPRLSLLTGTSKNASDTAAPTLERCRSSLASLLTHPYASSTVRWCKVPKVTVGSRCDFNW